MRRYAYRVKCPRWLRIDVDDLMLFVPMGIGTLALLDAWFGIPVERIITVITGG